MIDLDHYLAHSPTEACPEGQPLKDHLENVSQLCAAFCQPFGAEQDGRLCGLYHDLGKYSAAFQRRLAGGKERVDHSSVGALLLFSRRNIPASMCIAGHHGGLLDCGTRNDLSDTYMAKIARAQTEQPGADRIWQTELPKDIPSGSVNRPEAGNYFYIKMLFSALTDADWLDTEAYFADQPLALHDRELGELQDKLTAHIAPWQNATSEINRRRNRILQAAVAHGADEPGLFSMTVPTGGGKTLSSMAFALHHALSHRLRRVIYVIPYCSILEQTQHVFQDIFGEENLIAHYSGAEYPYRECGEDRRAFSAENWDAPIVLTTAVQFFESLFSDKPGRSRKLHNIAGSVIVFDEAQMLPVPFLKPCLAGICQLVEHFGCSAVLCTATQPAVEPLLQELLPGCQIRELCPEPDKMYQAFRRVRYRDDGVLTQEELLDRLREREQVLCVVNSRRQAQALYNGLAGCEGVFHLSTMMTPRDRKAVLQTVRERLKAGQACRVISTSLIEAGVDVDFPEVYRALAGLDSIIQAGGRCNREGKRAVEESLVHIFRTEEKAPRMMEQNISAAEHVLRSFSQPDAPEAVQAYFRFLLYTLKGEARLDEKQILSDLKALRFHTAAEKFRLIDGADCTVYIPLGEGAALAQTLRQCGPSRSLLRQLNQYGVGVYRQYFDRLCAIGAVEAVSENAGILLDLSLYARETGLPFAVSEQDKVLLI